ncbi:MAG: ribosome-associated translation inhibitor RaiA [Candidatus Marinimicrobia bacterium]|jgi:putative sigma-54 modulation protein|nr:ribosome-associated translation inhibitor RaiA [Candidatus Neomarinimicrobiota bacterium]MBT3618631.1 ribosome-associated translation inhibitor RaiA [Candidatus Neomarinimicrobiota bacterium]MBT3829663.1 ribosome-associated translation inhibitor RaiA [Candidatus Neomarinimicrobiota bacterium]MBT3997380.1 ribosome-associated translation inhibitor RaiA [Candidatus Neomarinimicrobiota bacterium]MBT4280437.1 ribosome-associated translation inhibitor RaiA [Candidatus Neomarinimicrobiota bacterium
MNIEFTARHFHAPDDVRNYAEEKVQKITTIFDRAINCQIILEHEHNEYSTELNLLMPQFKLNVKETSSNVSESIDRAVEKMLVRVKKAKGKMFSH